ncbi:hypothetical protein [Microvirga terrestris]|uniref:hypothetical protein n=1 Tax=Microvirga terrestris TaxID=2791024 RepID=UPI001FEF9133|nr:hypothetical protein [Microvirga terrestris]
MAQLDHTRDQSLKSWITSADGHPDLPIQNLPLEIFSTSSDAPRGGVAIGDRIQDLSAALSAGLFTGEAARTAEGCVRSRAQSLPDVRSGVPAGHASAVVRTALDG